MSSSRSRTAKTYKRTWRTLCTTTAKTRANLYRAHSALTANSLTASSQQTSSTTPNTWSLSGRARWSSCASSSSPTGHPALCERMTCASSSFQAYANNTSHLGDAILCFVCFRPVNWRDQSAWEAHMWPDTFQWWTHDGRTCHPWAHWSHCSFWLARRLASAVLLFERACHRLTFRACQGSSVSSSFESSLSPCVCDSTSHASAHCSLSSPKPDQWMPGNSNCYQRGLIVFKKVIKIKIIIYSKNYHLN